jgi:hypothetical protein
MDLKPHSSSNAVLEGAIDPAILVGRLAVRDALEGVESQNAAHELATAQLCYRRYTVPILEATTLLEERNLTEAARWATIQVLFGLSLRHMDNVLDSPGSLQSTAEESYLANAYLSRAQAMLHDAGSSWTPGHAALHGQFYSYEVEMRGGSMHDMSTLWRRASPLCVLLEIDLADRLRDERLIGLYRCYLSTMLLLADCNDAWGDAQHGPPTPVTLLLGESRTRDSMDFSAAASRILQIRAFAHREREGLLQSLEILGCTRWATVLREDASVGF